MPLYGKTGSIGFNEAPNGTTFEIIHVSGLKFSLLIDTKPVLLGVPWETIESLKTAICEAESMIKED